MTYAKITYNRKRVAGLVIASALVLLAVWPAFAGDLTVDGKLVVDSDSVMRQNARIAGTLRIGATNSTAVANVEINQIGSGVGIFLGDRPPFGQALFETDVTGPATHAWFAEMGSRVFSVTAGGNGFFNGNLDVRGDTRMKTDARVDGSLVIGNTGEFSSPPNPNTPPAKLHVLGNVAIANNESIGGDQSVTGDSSVHRNAFVDGFLEVGTTSVGKVIVQPDPNIPPPKLTVLGNAAITGNDTVGGNAAITGNASITGTESFGAQVRQMINLWNTDYGIGVQDFAFYERTGSDFFWYKAGQHSNNFGDAGGGTTLMQLDNTGALVVTRRVVTPVLEITGGEDVAEPFAMPDHNIPEGAVVVIDETNPGHLKLSEGAYDQRVAGIVSGANGISPGISLSQEGGEKGGRNVALSGRVYVLADASSNAIKPGDFLTTSDAPGYAMKVTDHAKAQGAIIGKAMSAMKEGKGMVLVLVTLQ